LIPMLSMILVQPHARLSTSRVCWPFDRGTVH
jgi:hypothetical protein